MKELAKKIIIKVLEYEALIYIKRCKPKIVAITGSLGKTGTKDAVAAVLKSEFVVRKSPKSFNSEFGIPLAILGLHTAWSNIFGWFKTIMIGFFQSLFGKCVEVLVLEVGADKPGDIKRASEWLKSDIVIITAVPEVPVHREFYPDSEAVLKEKSELVNALKDGGLLITGTDERVSTINTDKGNVARVSCDNAKILYKNGLPVGMEFIINSAKLHLFGVLGEHQCNAPAFALRVANEFGIKQDKALKELEATDRTPGRMRLLKGINGSVIIDDSYNSSPLALSSALKTLASVEVPGKKVAVLGDMKELGDASDREHRRAGIQAAHIVDELYTTGRQAELLARSAIEEGLPKQYVHIYEAGIASVLGKDLAKTLSNGDIVLVKGSQGGIRLEKAVAELIEDKTLAPKLLVRQDIEWQNR